MSHLKEHYKPGARDLTDEETDAAMKNLRVAPKLEYAERFKNKTVRPPIGQSVANISVMQFENVVKHPTTGARIFGMIRVEGAYPNENSATEAARNRIKTNDSTHRVMQLPMGAWQPLSDDVRVCSETEDVTENAESGKVLSKIGDEARRSETRIRRELQEAEEELKNNNDNDNPDHINYYIGKRLVERTARAEIYKHLMQIKVWIEKWNDFRDQALEIEQKHPEFVEKWIDVYQEKANAAFRDDEFVPYETGNLFHVDCQGHEILLESGLREVFDNLSIYP